MVDLPLGATEDRVCGTIDIEKALTEGVKAFEPGLLVREHPLLRRRGTRQDAACHSSGPRRGSDSTLLGRRRLSGATGASGPGRRCLSPVDRLHLSHECATGQLGAAAVAGWFAMCGGGVLRSL